MESIDIVVNDNIDMQGIKSDTDINGILFDDKKVLEEKLNHIFGQWFEHDCACEMDCED